LPARTSSSSITDPKANSEPLVRRPVTRSQTGSRTPKRWRSDATIDAGDKTEPEGDTQDSPSRTRSVKKSTSASTSVSDPLPSRTPSISSPSAADPLSSVSDILDPDSAAGNSTDPDAPCFTGPQRHPRRRAVQPVPVPNLTKKSRGRRVPVQQDASPVIEDGDSDPSLLPNTRMYACQVEGCGKCFGRGEHLKRHIRSIHTYEKR
jgi:hypothetical protein